MPRALLHWQTFRTLPLEAITRGFFLPRSPSRRPKYWYHPEHLPHQSHRDAELGRKAFYVYVLDTGYGHYVGHTWNVNSRLRQHQRNEVSSTADGNPTLIWSSRPFPTREEASYFEASLKSLRDQRSPRFEEIAGVEPRPFTNPHFSPKPAGCLLPILTAATLAVISLALSLL